MEKRIEEIKDTILKTMGLELSEPSEMYIDYLSGRKAMILKNQGKAVSFKRVTIPIIRRNYKFDSEEVYEKIMKSTLVAELLESKRLFLVKPIGENDYDPVVNAISVNPTDTLGIIRNFNKNEVTVDLISFNGNNQYSKYIIGCRERILGKFKEDETEDKFTLVDGKFICFDAVFSEEFSKMKEKYSKAPTRFGEPQYREIDNDRCEKETKLSSSIIEISGKKYILVDEVKWILEFLNEFNIKPIENRLYTPMRPWPKKVRFPETKLFLKSINEAINVFVRHMKKDDIDHKRLKREILQDLQNGLLVLELEEKGGAFNYDTESN